MKAVKSSENVDKAPVIDQTQVAEEKLSTEKKNKKPVLVDNTERPTILQSFFGGLLGFGIPFVIFFIIIGIFYFYSKVNPQISFAIAAVLSFVFFWVLDATQSYRVVWAKAIPVAIIFFYLACQAWYIGFYERPNEDKKNLEQVFQGQAGDIKDIFIPWREYSTFGSRDCDYDLICQQDTFKYRGNQGYYGGTMPFGPTYCRIIFYTKGEVKIEPGNSFR